jgi:hypothetical protein
MALKDNRLLARCFLLGFALLVLSGCQEADEIRQYQAPRVEYPKARLLGAIVPRKDYFWFFKLEGPPDAVAAHEKNYERFIQSLRFSSDEKEPLTWTVPDDWRHQRGPGDRYATFHMTAKGTSLELTVRPLDAKANSVFDNVNRWRAGLDLYKVGDEQELAKVIKKIKVENEDVVLVDILGNSSLVKSAGMKGQMPRVPMAGQRDLVDRGLPRVPPPPGWREIEPEKQTIADVRQVKAFLVGEGAQQADVRVKVMSLMQSSFLENVNRWRKDPLRLPAINETELALAARKIPCMGGEADYVDLQGSPTGLRRLGVLFAKGRTTWVFMMTGPEALVGEQKAAFEKYVKSFSL